LHEFYDSKDTSQKNQKSLNIRVIDFSNYDSVCLYYAKIFGKFFCFKKFWPKYKKLKKLLDIGYERLNQEFELIKMIKALRDV